MVTRPAWPLRTIGDVCFVDFDFGGDDAHVGNGHQETALGILNAGHDILADADVDVADDSVNRRSVGGLAQHVLEYA